MTHRQELRGDREECWWEGGAGQRRINGRKNGKTVIAQSIKCIKNKNKTTQDARIIPSFLDKSIL